jgi:hypothetical protein
VYDQVTSDALQVGPVRLLVLVLVAVFGPDELKLVAAVGWARARFDRSY